MSTARPAPPGQSAPTFSPGSDQYVNGLPSGFVFPGTEVLDPREIFAGPGYQAPRQRTDPVATISLILTVLAPVPFLGALAALSGWWALRRLRGSYATGHAQAWLGVIVGSATTVGWLWMWWITSYTA